jgi:UMF1 family MFS transporter
MYDWANSVYQLSITSAILPAYYSAVAKGDAQGMVNFFGLSVLNTTLYAWAVSASFLIVALVSPMLSAIADVTGRRLLFMKLFTWLGSLSCMALYFFTPQRLELGIVAFTLAGIGYSGSLVFYNAWLPELAPKGEEDRISAKGYALGYLGGILLLLLNLAMILKPGWFGIEEKGMPARIAFVTVGIWWLLFAQIPFRVLPSKLPTRKTDSSSVTLLLGGYRELLRVWQLFKAHAVMKRYLAAFFFTMMAVLTIMYMAANFGKKELGLSDSVLIPTVLLIQFLGILGALLFAKLALRMGSIRVLLLTLLVWMGICLAAWFVNTALQFMVLAAFVGLVMGAVQALARSTWSRLLPNDTDHTSFFSFYDVAEKMAVVSGTFLFGLFEWFSGSMRASVVMLGIVFFLAFATLYPLRKVLR